jgi:hypothetical protein
MSFLTHHAESKPGLVHAVPGGAPLLLLLLLQLLMLFHQLR